MKLFFEKNDYLCGLLDLIGYGRQQFHRLCKIESVEKYNKLLKIGSRVYSIADFYFSVIMVIWVKICIFVHILLLICYSEHMDK